MRKEQAFRQTNKACLDQAIHAARLLARPHTGVCAAYDRLLRQVQQRTPLLNGRGSASSVATANAALLMLAQHHGDWLRPVEDWRPPTVRPWPLFTSLAHHLFARQAVPNFMTSVWFEFSPPERLRQHEWYKHLGQGRSIRTATLPLRYTRAMAQRFVQAPDHFKVFPALRWAQVRGLGGGERLACAVSATSLGSIFAHEDFWETVLDYLIKHPRLDLRHIGPIIDFVRAQRFGGQRPAPQPDYTLAGRTVASVLSEVEQWQRYGIYTTVPAGRTWPRSPYPEFHLVEGEDLGNVCIWTITELLTSQELIVEGTAMQHCVASYAHRCARKETSIWSMQVENRAGRQRALTVEVDLRTHAICQAKGQRNRLAHSVERVVLDLWARHAGLKGLAPSAG